MGFKGQDATPAPVFSCDTEVRRSSGRKVAGRSAPPGKRMGHAGAIISGGKGTAAEKVAVLEECGISVAASPAEMAQALLKVYKP